MQTDFDKIVNDIGEVVRIKYYSLAFSGADYDSIGYLSQSGNILWVSGVIQPIGGKNSTEDFKFLEQGRILINDSKLYLNGSVTLYPVSGTVKVIVGSPTIRGTYYPTDLGTNTWYLGGASTYQRTFIRVLNNGSWINEI